MILQASKGGNNEGEVGPAGAGAGNDEDDEEGGLC